MLFQAKWMRRGFLAAFLATAGVGHADVSTRFDPVSGTIVAEGLSETQRDLLASDPASVKLQVEGLDARNSMPLTLEIQSDALRILPRFNLRAGADYALQLELDGGAHVFRVSVPHPTAEAPRLVGFAPSQALIPANTLRLYLTFSEPMARGGLRENIRLLRSDGSEVPSPFLTLGPELWDATQTRVTLLFDPGRIKQGVGPNVSHGAPLVAGETYRLVVNRAAKSALGAALGEDAQVSIRIGPPETSPVDPTDWQVLEPAAGTQAPITIAFDRIMDAGAVQRLIRVRDFNGQHVTGTIVSDGGGWSMTPDRPWRPGAYEIAIEPALEDVSGNALGMAFDAPAGTIGTEQKAVKLMVRIGL